MSGRLGRGLAVPPGELHVLSLPDADRDVDPHRRPSLGVTDGAVRAIAVGPGGRVLADATLTAGQTLAIPPGSRRVAVAGLGSSAAAREGDAKLDVVGWANDVPLPYVGGEAFLGFGAVVVSSGRVPSRRTAAVRTGWVAADTVVGGASAVVTTFARAVDVVAVAMEGGDGDDLALGIEGAQRSAEPPTIVADGPRAVAIFPVVPEKGMRVIVTIATGPRRRLVGVAGSLGITPDAFAAAVAAQGFPTVVPDPLPAATGAALVLWKEP
jgi:hypothetical protein